MGQRLRVCTVFPENQRLVPIFHIKQLITACNSRSRETQSMSLASKGSCPHMPPPKNAYIHNLKKKVFKKKENSLKTIALLALISTIRNKPTFTQVLIATSCANIQQANHRKRKVKFIDPLEDSRDSPCPPPHLSLRKACYIG